ncbi:hypothetical protein AOLI_G00239840 [Acnodon oligacanthus]
MMKLTSGDLSIVIIVVLAGSCTLLLLAIIVIATSCNKRKLDKRGDGFPQKMAQRPPASMNPKTKAVDQNWRVIRLCLAMAKSRCDQITIWKGNSYTTVSARDPQFSGKDSGKGDSDFNDSDSDISGDGLKKDGHQNNAQNGKPRLCGRCTSECKILGHSDRCWSPTAARASNSSAKTGSLPRDSLRRENYFQAHIPKTVGLQSVYEKVLHREYDYVLVPPPQPVRVREINDVTIPVYSPTTARCPINEV